MAGSSAVFFDGPPMYWLIPLGFVVGCIIIVLFEWYNGGLTSQNRVRLYREVMNKKEGILHENLSKALELNIDGPVTMMKFWSGAAMTTDVSREKISRVYETLALISALMLTICVTFYTANEPGDRLFGIVCCLSNCALWMATLSSTFLAVIINCLHHDSQMHPLVDLYGIFLMRVPMLLLVWGTMLIFLQFILYFKTNVDPGFPCSVCIGGCFVLAPLFFHCMHKMCWCVSVINIATELPQVGISVDEMKDALCSYYKAKDNYYLNMDKEEFLDGLPRALKKLKLTSVETELASQLFDVLTLREVNLLKESFAKKLIVM